MTTRGAEHVAEGPAREEKTAENAKKGTRVGSDDPRDGFVNDPKIRAIVGDYLRRRHGAQPADADDVLQVTHTLAWENASIYPLERQRFIRYWCRVARNDLADFRKSEQRQQAAREFVQENSIDRGVVAPSSVREIVQFFDVHVEGVSDEVVLEMIYEAFDRDLDFDEVARERGIDPKTAYKQRDRFRSNYYALWASALILLGLTGWRLATTPRHDVPIVRDDYPPPPPKPTATPEQRAAAIRDEALKNCDVLHEEECAGKLNEAVQLSPAIADDPHVRELLLRFAYTIPGWDAGGPHDASKTLKRP